MDGTIGSKECFLTKETILSLRLYEDLSFTKNDLKPGIYANNM